MTCISYLYLCLLDRDVDDVHDMMDDISEQTELANEISDAISSSVGFGQDVDEVRNCLNYSNIIPENFSCLRLGRCYGT